MVKNRQKGYEIHEKKENPEFASVATCVYMCKISAVLFFSAAECEISSFGV
jgi:hypothetical protein